MCNRLRIAGPPRRALRVSRRITAEASWRPGSDGWELAGERAGAATLGGLLMSVAGFSRLQRVPRFKLVVAHTASSRRAGGNPGSQLKQATLGVIQLDPGVSEPTDDSARTRPNWCWHEASLG